MKSENISFPVIYSVLMHTVAVCLILMLPIYGGSAGPASFIGYLVFLNGGKEAAPGITPYNKNRSSVGKVRERKTAGTEKRAKRQEETAVEKIEKPSEKITSPTSAEEAHSGEVKTEADVPEETALEKAETEKGDNNDKDLSAGQKTSAPPTTPAEQVNSSAVPSGPSAVAAQTIKEISPDTPAIAGNHDDKEKGLPSGKEAAAPARVLPTASENTAHRDAPAAPVDEGGTAVERPKALAQDKAGNGEASKAVHDRAQEKVPAVSPAAHEDNAHLPVAGPGPQAPGQQTASARQQQKETAGGENTKKQQTGGEAKPAPIGIAGAAALLPKDIRIEVAVTGDDRTSVFTRLSMKNYPTAAGSGSGSVDRPVNTEEERSPAKAQLGIIFSVVKAGKGIYTFVIGNGGRKTCVADVSFLLLERTTRARKKEYKAVQLPPGTGMKFKFLVPDAIFWDDEDRFSGSTEDSDSIMKFNSDTGLVWRERKDE